VRFDPKTKIFAKENIPSGGGVIRNMAATPKGQIYLACVAQTNWRSHRQAARKSSKFAASNTNSNLGLQQILYVFLKLTSKFGTVIQRK
jgi:hypothetical protein